MTRPLRLLTLLLTLMFVVACGGGGSTQSPGGGGGTSASPGGGGGGGTSASPGGGGASASPGGGESQPPAQGGSITVTSLWGGAEEENFRKVLDAFTAKTGITAEYEGVRQDYATALDTRITGGNPPDVAIIPGIGFLRRFARDGSIKTMSELGVNVDASQYAPGILEVGQVDGEQYAIMVKFNSKSTMWYRPDTFEELGVEPAEDWDSFKTLLQTIKDKGQTPLGLGVSPDDWTLTDWFESIYVRQAGPEAYDRLFSAEGNWTDQTVKDAITELQAVLKDEYVVGGINGALGTGFVDGIGQVFSDNPQAVMYYEGGFVGGIATGQVNTELQVPDQINWFDFPSINGGDAVTIGGDVIAALTTNPGVKEFIEYMASAESGQVWAETGAIVSPIKGVDTSVYPNELVQREAEQVANASAVRFDGSDLLPAGGPNLGALLQQAIQGNDVNGLLEDFQTQVQTAWENEQ
jgi:alpha-glucoside transport system substrate-binding protein